MTYRRPIGEVYRLMGYGWTQPAYAPDLVTPLDKLRKVIAWEIEQAARLTQQCLEPRNTIHRIAA